MSRNLYDTNYDNTELDRINIDYAQYFSTDKTVENIMDNELAKDMNEFLIKSCTIGLVKIDKKNRRYLEHQHINEIFESVLSNFESRCNSILVFDAVTTYYEIEPSTFWEGLSTIFKDILREDLKQSVIVKKPLSKQGGDLLKGGWLLKRW